MKTEDFIKIVKPFSMTSIDRITYLFNSLEYLRQNKIDGDYVECGVWRGGNILGIIEYLNYHNNYNSNVWLYDTFNGMTAPEDLDITRDGIKAADIIKKRYIRCKSKLWRVKDNLSKSNYPKEKIKYIIGDICQTLLVKENIPEKIALLRLDTDWYKSTKIELEVLWKKLVSGGVLIIDDYGSWKGCKLAVDNFFSDKNYSFKKIDDTGIALTK